MIFFVLKWTAIAIATACGLGVIAVVLFIYLLNKSGFDPS
jgi:hypothetical protein